MTLVLTAATPKRVMQVSDRRMTSVDRRGDVTYNDVENKAVLYCGSATIAYTGLGDIQGQATDYWVVQELVSAGSVREAVEILQIRATEEFARLPASVPRWARKHSFVVAGWAQFESGGQLSPYITLISNFQRDEDVFPEPQDSFHVSLMRPNTPESALFVPAGEHLTQPEHDWCRQEIAYHLEEDRDTSDLVEILAGQVRFVSKRALSVGRGLMIMSLPLAGVRRNLEEGFAGLYSQLIDDERVTSFNMPPDESTATFEAPHIVCDGVISAGYVKGPSRERVEQHTVKWRKTRRPR
jgi:hypothetical protein